MTGRLVVHYKRVVVIKVLVGETLLITTMETKQRKRITDTKKIKKIKIKTRIKIMYIQHHKKYLEEIMVKLEIMVMEMYQVLEIMRVMIIRIIINIIIIIVWITLEIVWQMMKCGDWEWEWKITKHLFNWYPMQQMNQIWIGYSTVLNYL